MLKFSFAKFEFSKGASASVSGFPTDLLPIIIPLLIMAQGKVWCTILCMKTDLLYSRIKKNGSWYWNGWPAQTLFLVRKTFWFKNWFLGHKSRRCLVIAALAAGRKNNNRERFSNWQRIWEDRRTFAEDWGRYTKNKVEKYVLIINCNWFGTVILLSMSRARELFYMSRRLWQFLWLTTKFWQWRGRKRNDWQNARWHKSLQAFERRSYCRLQGHAGNDEIFYKQTSSGLKIFKPELVFPFRQNYFNRKKSCNWGSFIAEQSQLTLPKSHFSCHWSWHPINSCSATW